MECMICFHQFKKSILVATSHTYKFDLEREHGSKSYQHSICKHKRSIDFEFMLSIFPEFCTMQTVYIDKLAVTVKTLRLQEMYN